MDYIPGKLLRSVLREKKNSREKIDLIYQFGALLRKIHNSEVPKKLINNNKVWIDSMIEKAEFNLNNYAVDGSLRLLNKLKKEKPKFYKQNLIHGDYTLDNVLVLKNKIIGVIDWSGGAYGDSRYDLALATRPKVEAFNQSEEIEAFYDGYGSNLLSKEEYDYFVNLYEFFNFRTKS